MFLITAMASSPNPTNVVVGERRGSKVHTINNQSPYQGMPITEGRGKYPVIFEPLQNIQASRSTYKVTSLIDFEPYLQYFHNFEAYLAAFKISLAAMENDPVMKEFTQLAHAATMTGQGDPCSSHARCHNPALTYRPIDPRQQATAYKRLRDQCLSRHMQACLTLKQFEYINNVTDLIDNSYKLVKGKFLQAIDYIADSGLDVPEEPGTEGRQKRSVKTSQFGQFSTRDLEYLRYQLTELAMWTPGHNRTNRAKRIVDFFVSAGAAIGALINSGQIKQIKKNIEILQEVTILQGQKIDELARYADLTAEQVRQHDSQIYKLHILPQRNDRCYQLSNLCLISCKCSTDHSN